MANLMSASNQWATRPKDERFWGLKDLEQFLQTEKGQSGERTLTLESLKAVVTQKGLGLVGDKFFDPQAKKKGDMTPAQLTHWSFGQICTGNTDWRWQCRNCGALMPAQYCQMRP